MTWFFDVLKYSGFRKKSGVLLDYKVFQPVVGIPVCGTSFLGLDALLSTVQMPSGIPVATVAVNGAANAALLCIEMLAIEDEGLAKALEAKRAKDTAAVLEKNRGVEERFNKD